MVFVFGQDQTEEEPSSLGFLDKMLAQLVYRKKTPSHATAALYKSEAFQSGKASAKAYQDAIRSEVNRFSRVLFIIDGIDMQSDKERILNRLHKLPDHAQLLITMRETRYASKDECLSVLAAPEDIETYVSGEVDQNDDLTALLKKYPSQLKTAVVQQVVQKSHGLYDTSYLVHFDGYAYSYLGFSSPDCTWSYSLDAMTAIYCKKCFSTFQRV